MSPELLAALLGAVAGGILALLGGIAQVFMQNWISERGKITYDVVAWDLRFDYHIWESPDSREQGAYTEIYALGVPWAEARTYKAEPSAANSKEMTKRFSLYNYDTVRSYYAKVVRGHFKFTINFLNTKGTNAAVLEYSIHFLKGKRPLITKLPRVVGQYKGQALALPAENVAGFAMEGSLDKEEGDDEETFEKVVEEADSVVLTARLSTGRDIRVEIKRLSRASKVVEKGDAT